MTKGDGCCDALEDKLIIAPLFLQEKNQTKKKKKMEKSILTKRKVGKSFEKYQFNKITFQPYQEEQCGSSVHLKRSRDNQL